MNFDDNKYEYEILLNIYNSCYIFRKTINIEIENYFIHKSKTKPFLDDIFFYIENYLSGYIYEVISSTKLEYLDLIRNSYHENPLSKKIFKYILMCYNCKDKCNFNKYMYYCFNCDETFCTDCCTECDKCIDDERDICHHCKNCKKECLNME